jgi:hypothetical protein
MASIRNRNGKWQVRISRQGYPSTTKSFNSRGLAEKWAKIIKNKIVSNDYQSIDLARHKKFKDSIERYLYEVTYKSKSTKEDSYRLKAMMPHWIGSIKMIELTQSKVIQFRDERLKLVSNGTVIRETVWQAFHAP